MCPDGTTGAATGGNVHMLQFDNIGINNENEEATVSNFTFTQNDRGSTITRIFLSRQIGYCWTVNPPPQCFETHTSYQTWCSNGHLRVHTHGGTPISSLIGHWRHHGIQCSSNIFFLNFVLAYNLLQHKYCIISPLNDVTVSR